LPPTDETTILESLQVDGNYPFSLVIISPYKNKQNIWIFEIFLKNENISLSKYLNFKNLHENLKRKLTKPHIFFKWTLKKIKINAFNICVAHLWFINTYIEIILDAYVATTITHHIAQHNACHMLCKK